MYYIIFWWCKNHWCNDCYSKWFYLTLYYVYICEHFKLQNFYLYGGYTISSNVPNFHRWTFTVLILLSNKHTSVYLKIKQSVLFKVIYAFIYFTEYNNKEHYLTYPIILNCSNMVAKYGGIYLSQFVKCLFTKKMLQHMS